MQDLFSETQTKDFDTWYKVFSGPDSATREEYGVKTVSVARDTSNPNNAVIHFEIEDVARLKEFLARPDFAQFSERAGVIKRKMYLGAPLQ